MPADTILCSDHGLLPKVPGLDHLLGFRRAFSMELDRPFRAADPVLVHAHFGIDSTTAMTLADRLQVPLIVTLHGYDVTMRDSVFRTSVGGNLYLMRRKQLWRRANLFLCVSNYIRRRAIEAGFPEMKLRVHYIGVDRRVFWRNLRAGRDKVVLFVGRLVEKKGCEYVIRAMAQVRLKHPDARLVVIGDGPLRHRLQELSNQLGIACTFEGIQPIETVIRWLGVAKVFCVPSVTARSGDSEALGMVFAEAQASGVPVVSSKHGGIPEVVIDGETGLLAPERDAVTLAAHLNRLLGDNDLWQRYSDRGVEWMARQFDLDTQTRELEQIYSEVIPRSRVAFGRTAAAVC
jgi:colanic acid/amylovoran biosynthesis glycosyltransferase